MPSRNNALNASPVARRFANTTGSAELDTSDIRYSHPALVIRRIGAACKAALSRFARAPNELANRAPRPSYRAGTQKKSRWKRLLGVFTGRRQTEWTGATRVQKLDNSIMGGKP